MTTGSGIAGAVDKDGIPESEDGGSSSTDDPVSPPDPEFDRKTWQSGHPRIQDQPIEELCFPGVHHAAMYDYDAADWWYTQSRDVYTQLNDGIRYLDIRVKAEEPLIGEEINFVGHHGGDPSRDGANGWDLVAKDGAPLDTVFAHIRDFLDEVAAAGANEMLMIKFSHFWDDTNISDMYDDDDDWFETIHWDAFEDLIDQYLGPYLLSRSNRGTWSDMIANTSLSDFDGPRVAVFYKRGRIPDWAWEMPSSDGKWQGYSVGTVRPGDVYTDAMEQDLGAIGWAVTANGGKIFDEGADQFEDFFLPDGYEDKYDHLREAAWKLNQLLGGIVEEVKTDPGKSPRLIYVDYYENSKVVEYARELSIFGVNNSAPGDIPPIDEAVYTIRSQDSGDVIEGQDNGDVEEEEYEGEARRRWEFRRNDDGSYVMENAETGKYLGQADDDIEQEDFPNLPGQQWYAIPLRDGNYCFLNKKSAKVIDGANPLDNVHPHEWHSFPNQRWELETRREIRSELIVEPSLYRLEQAGYYNIYAATVADSSTADGANVEADGANDEPGQLFSFEPLSDGTYRIVNVKSGKVIDGYWLEHGTEVHQWPWHGGDNQRWYVEEVGHGRYAIVNKASGLVLTRDWEGDGRNIRQKGWDNGHTQRWEINQPDSVQLSDADYQVQSVDSGLVADVKYMSSDTGADIWLWERNYTGAQKFRFERLDDGTYKIVNVHSGKIVDGQWPYDGRNVLQWDWHARDNQRWYVYDVGNGKYALVNKASGRVLDGSGPNKQDTVHLWEWHGGDNQRWRLHTV